jgi:hypothetical protein
VAEKIFPHHTITVSFKCDAPWIFSNPDHPQVKGSGRNAFSRPPQPVLNSDDAGGSDPAKPGVSEIRAITRSRREGMAKR